MKQFKKGLFVFHRDLRIDDNRGLQAALAQSETVVPLFIIDPVQVEKANHYRSNNALQFMSESLDDLAETFHKRGAKLYFFYGHTHAVIEKLLKQENVDALFFNRDYTPFARKRDADLELLAKKHNVQCHVVEDALLINPDSVFTGSGTPYTIYSAFLKKASEASVADPMVTRGGHFFTGHCADSLTVDAVIKGLYTNNVQVFVHGGASVGKKMLSHLGDFKKYTHTRDIPELPTTGLSAHLKIGTVSVRQAYAAINDHKADPTLIKQLYWRDFFTYLGYHFPYVFGKAFQKKYHYLKWQTHSAWFDRWCEGMTGFPLVDAGMRQLVATGWMHNRVRMVVASFLTKDLHIDWQLGEKFFAQQLVDYDPCVNNGNWQWSASTGADAQPYFRIFNPWLQQKKFDPECVYIKKWVPELRDLDAKAIHMWYKATASYKKYPLPLIDHALESKKAIASFRSV